MLSGTTNRVARQIPILLAAFGSALLFGALFWRSDGRGLWEFLPILLLVVCPLMHFSLHRQHGRWTDTEPQASCVSSQHEVDPASWS